MQIPMEEMNALVGYADYHAKICFKTTVMLKEEENWKLVKVTLSN